MIAPLSLSNVLTVLLAIGCLWTMLVQSHAGVVRLWRLSLPPIFAAVQALVLLAGVFEATFAHDAEWVAAALVGAAMGRMRGWSLPIQVDQMWGLVRVRNSGDGVLAATVLVALAAIDFTSAALERPVIEPEHVAAGAALCAGYLGCRGLAMVVRAMRSPHVELHDGRRSSERG
jgi:hypothetical protein